MLIMSVAADNSCKS